MGSSPFNIPEGPVGRVVDGKYEIERVLAKGGVGTVYAARHVLTMRKVAIKLVHRFAVDRSANAKTRFFREAQAPSSIKHPGIPEVLDAGTDEDGTLYLVMELLQGRDLTIEFARGRVPPRRLGRWIVEVLDALGAAHAQGFVHRDVKPGNIFITKTANGKELVKLLDFGVVRQNTRESWHGLTREGTLIGTPAYMSPEQANGEVATVQADLWGVGAVMFHGLTGTLPVVAETQLETLSKVSRGELEPWPAELQLPQGMHEVMFKALTPRLEARWASAKAMKQALIECLEADPPPSFDGDTATVRASIPVPMPPTADDTSPPPSTVREGGLPRWVWGLAVGGLLGLIVAVLWLTQTAPHSSKSLVAVEPPPASTPRAPAGATVTSPPSSIQGVESSPSDLETATTASSRSSSALTNGSRRSVKRRARPSRRRVRRRARKTESRLRTSPRPAEDSAAPPTESQVPLMRDYE